MHKADVFIFAGEVSGDLHGEQLLQALKKKDPDLKILGVGGPKMRAVGMETVMPMERFQVMGFIDVFLALPRLMAQFYAVRRAIIEANPKVVICIDYPGFNLRLEKSLRKKGFKGKICHYISPTVWVYGKKRVQTLAKNVDLLLTILPFEKKCYEGTSLQVEYVGHPLITRISSHRYEKLSFFVEDKPVVGLFPGSREKEIVKNFPIYLEVASKLLEKWPDLFFPVSVSHERFSLLLERLILESKFPREKIVLVPFEKRYDLMKGLTAAIAKSGTVILELALHRVPTVVTYGITKLDVFIAKDILKIRLPYYSLPNIICNKEVFPEYYGPKFTEENVYSSIEAFLLEKHRARLQEDFDLLQTLLEKKDTGKQAAAHIMDMLNSRR